MEALKVHTGDGLDAIPWAELEHAYGPAVDTPTHLRRLVAKGSATRRSALRSLSVSVYHQGGGYSASPVVMEILLKLAMRSETRQRAGIFRLYCDLGMFVNHRAWIVAACRDPAPWLAQWYPAEAQVHFLASYELFCNGWPRYRTLLATPGDAKLRAWAAYAMAWLPAKAVESAAAIGEALRRERSSWARASMLIALGVLARSLSGPARASLVTTIGARPKGPAHLWLAHATATLLTCEREPDGETAQTLMEAVTTEAYLAGFPWFHGALARMAASLLVEHAGRHEWDAGPMFERALGARPEHPHDDVTVRLAAQMVTASHALRAAIPAISAEGRAQLEAIARRPNLLRAPGGELRDALSARGLPNTIESIADALGWFAPPPRARTLGATWTLGEDLPVGLTGAPVDLRAMVCRFFPFDGALLHRVAEVVDWSALSRNRRLRLDETTLLHFAARWSRWDLAKNRAIKWSEPLIAKLASWRALGERSDLPWSVAFLERHRAELDWGAVSRNPALPWTTDLIDRFKDEWEWHLLSQNPGLPWSETLLRRYRRWYWTFLSGNDGVPWADPQFFARHRSKLDPCEMCELTTFPWTEEFVAEHAEWLSGWRQLSENPALPWSLSFISRYQDRWDWSRLSKNRGIPWSESLFAAFAERWDWSEIVVNPSVGWDALVQGRTVLAQAGRIQAYGFRYDQPQIRWTDELVNHPALQHLLTPYDDELYDRYLASKLDEAGVCGILLQARGLDEGDAAERLERFRKHGPWLPDEHPLHKALGMRARSLEASGD